MNLYTFLLMVTIIMCVMIWFITTGICATINNPLEAMRYG